MSILNISLILIICILLASITYTRKMLDAGGALTAFFLGMVLGTLGGIVWIFLLLIFLGSAFLATKYKFEYKEERGFHEGLEGERGVVNVLANGSVPFIIALLQSSNSYLALELIPVSLGRFLFVTAVAAAASDTLASEMGVLSDDTYLITTFEKVEPGVNGGVSWWGEMWALFGSTYTFIIAYFVFISIDRTPFSLYWIPLGVITGFLSCQLDSLLGASLERKKMLSKSSVNFMSISLSILSIGVLIWLIAY